MQAPPSLPAVVALRPPDWHRLFAHAGQEGGAAKSVPPLPPPPVPALGCEAPALAAFDTPLAPTGGGGTVPPLSAWCAPQLYDEAIFVARSGAESPKATLQRLARELRVAVRDTAVALADEAMGEAGEHEESAREPRSAGLAARCQHLQLNIMHILSRLREREAWARIEAAAAIA